MPFQQSKEPVETIACQEGIVMPLNLLEFSLVSQEWHEDGSVSLVVRARREAAACPRCQNVCHQIHDCRCCCPGFADV